MADTTFYGLPLLSAPGRVMTPRATTERLVEAALERIDEHPATVVDVGTGSGAIAVALASAAPRATVWATDTSRRAVRLATKNVRRHGLSDRVFVTRGDLLAAVPGRIDLVVANLPYLPAAEARRRPELDREPHDAVFADGDGLDPYRRLLSACSERLEPTGAVVIQLHRQVLAASWEELDELSDRIERHAGHRVPALTPRLAGAIA
jgi:HemK-like putative methylase